jgi:tetratricopeptide (TPR) repeat protein
MGAKRGISKLFSFILAGAMMAGAAGCLGCGGKTSDPGRSQTRLDLAKSFLSEGGEGYLEKAEQEANKALAFQSNNEEAENVLGLVYLLRARENFLLVEIDQCLTGVDADAIRLETDEHFATADRHFTRATKLAPDFGEAWANRGAIAIQLENHDAALEFLSTALGLPTRLIDIGTVRSNLGWAYFLKGDHVRAAKELLQAYQFRPGGCLATYRLGRVYFGRKEWEKAADKFREVSEQPSCLKQQDAHLFLMKALKEQHAGGGPESEAARARCLSISPESCIAAQCRSMSVSSTSVDE